MYSRSSKQQTVPAGRHSDMRKGLCVSLLCALFAVAPLAHADDYMKSLESEAKQVKSGKRVSGGKAGKSNSAEDPYLSALEDEADELETQGTNTDEDDTPSVRYRRLQY